KQTIKRFSGSARHSYTHTQGTRPEGLGGSRDAGPAAADPRPPYVIEAHNNVGGGYGYGYGYSCTGRTGRTREGTAIAVAAAAAAAAAADLEGLFNYRLLRRGEDEGPALADLETFFLPIAGELTADSTLFFFDLYSRYGYGYSYSRRPYCYTGPIAYSDNRNRVRIRVRIRIRIRIRNEINSGIRVRAGNSSYNSHRNSYYNNSYYDSRYNNRNNSSIRTYLWPYRTYAPYSRYLRPRIRTWPEGLGGSRNAGPAAADPRPPYVTKALYGPYRPYEGRNV
ncbi:hypothetical protein L249_8763, partial [Ophiocordyceps polyrhachis-furcata BCC 54312]